MPRSRTFCLVTAAALCLTAACDDDESVTSPMVDSVPPEIVVSAAPATGRATEAVTLEWAASDDIGLASVSVAWGVVGALQTVRAEGRSLEGSFSNIYDRIGEFTVQVHARDGAGNTATATHAITIGSPAPSAASHITVVVDGNSATIDWQPGDWSTSQEIVVSRTGGTESDQLLTLGGSAHEVDIDDLSWEASYEAKVIAVNELGRAESEPVAFDVVEPVAPRLFRFSSAIDDSTCLVVVWEHGPHASETYDVVVTGDTQAESFTESLPVDADLPFDMQQVRFCASDYPVVDGMTYAAQVFARFGDGAYGSDVRDWTVDFDPTYLATGSWSGETWIWSPVDGQTWQVRRQTLELVEADGTITGTWARFDAGGALQESGSVAGTRVGKSVELSLAVFGADYTSYWLGGSFAGAEGIAGTFWVAGLGVSRPVFYQRD